MKLSESTAIVTGAASGLGKASVEALLAAGVQVLATDILPDFEFTGGAAGDGAVISQTCDVTSESDVAGAIEVAVQSFGRLDIVINCGGVIGTSKIINRNAKPLDLDEFKRVIDVNLIGTINVARLTAAQMATQNARDGEKGVIITVASIAGLDGVVGHAAYTSSKVAVAGVTHTLALDLAPHQIRVMCIAPGAFETGMLKSLTDKAYDLVVGAAHHPSRAGRPEEFAELALHIITNQMLNGDVIRIDAAARIRS